MSALEVVEHVKGQPWTEAQIRAEAAKYDGKVEFERGHNSAYNTCLKRFPGLMDEMFVNKLQYWGVEDVIRQEALKYTSRVDFMRNSQHAYLSAVAKFPQVLDEVFGENARRQWSKEMILAEALKFASRSEFKEGASRAYKLFRDGFPDELDAIFPQVYTYWGNEGDVRQEAGKYRTKTDFCRGCSGAYESARKMKILDDCGFELGFSGFDSSAPAHLYVAELTMRDGESGVLFGITRRLKRRYKLKEREMMSNGYSYKFSTGADALSAETHLKREFVDFAALEGQSPLLFKKGTAGEIVVGVPMDVVISALSMHCMDTLPEPVPW